MPGKQGKGYKVGGNTASSGASNRKARRAARAVNRKALKAAKRG